MITVISTIRINEYRKDYFAHSLTSISPIASLLSWRLNIAGEHRQWACDLIGERWDNTHVTLDDNETCSYDLFVEQLAPLPDDALVYPWTEDTWFVCPYAPLFLHVLDRLIHSRAEVMPVSHLLTVWKENALRPAITATDFYLEYLVDLNSQERVWETLPDAYWTISTMSIFKVALLRESIESNREVLLNSCRPHGFELPPDAARKFLAGRSFIRLVPLFHVFREAIGELSFPARCMDIPRALAMIKLRDEGDKFGDYPLPRPAKGDNQ